MGNRKSLYPMMERRDPNQNDIELERCPLCNKAVVWDAFHACKEMLVSEEYISETLGIRLLWTRDNGWRSYWLAGGDVIEDLTFADVFNWTSGENSLFAPVEH